MSDAANDTDIQKNSESDFSASNSGKTDSKSDRDLD